MALKNLFDMVKADRYTADGREALIKAQKAETEDKVYQIGEISQKTGLQKTANGWVKPKSGKQPGAKKEEYKPSRRVDPKKQPQVSNPNVLGMTSSGAKKRFEALGGQFVENKNGVDVFKTRDGDLVEVHYDDNKKVLRTQTTPAEKTGSQSAEETKTETTAKFETEQENAKYEEGKKGWETVSKERLPAIKEKVQQKIDYYKKYDPYAMLGKRTGLNAQQKKAVEQNMAQAKENLAFFTGQLEGINEQMGATDSAPRVLTGDIRIRVRKA